MPLTLWADVRLKQIRKEEVKKNIRIHKNRRNERNYYSDLPHKVEAREHNEWLLRISEEELKELEGRK